MKGKISGKTEFKATSKDHSQARSQDCQNEEADRSSAPSLPSPPVPLEVGPLNPARGSGGVL